MHHNIQNKVLFKLKEILRQYIVESLALISDLKWILTCKEKKANCDQVSLEYILTISSINIINTNIQSYTNQTSQFDYLIDCNEKTNSLFQEKGYFKQVYDIKVLARILKPAEWIDIQPDALNVGELIQDEKERM